MESRVSKYFNYVLQESKKTIIVEAEEDSKKKEDPGKPEYKVNAKLNIDKSTDLSYKTYVTLFVEALNSLDAMASIATSVDPEYGPVKNYKSERYKIALIDQSTPEGLKKAWSKMTDIAGGSGKGLFAVVQNNVVKDDSIKKYQEEKKALDAQKSGESGRQITDEYYSQELIKLKEKYSALIDKTRVLTLSKLAKALSYYAKAIEVFQRGADAEVSYVEKSGADLEAFCEKTSDAISNIVLSKKPQEKKLESYAYIDDERHVLSENFGGFLNTGKAFATGIVNPGAFNKDNKAGSSDKASIVYAAENLKGALMSAASEIDNVINFKKNISGEAEGENKKGDDAAKQTADEAKSSASEMISFIQESFKYVVNINKELEGTESLKSIKSKLDDIANQLKIYRRPGGTLDQWKNDVLGEYTKGEGRGRIASSADLQKGRELMAMASSLAAEVSKAQEIKKEVESKDANKVLKKAVDAYKGTSSEAKPSRIKTRDDVETFPKKGEQNKEVVKGFQQRLIDLGHLPQGTPNGVYDDATQKATKIAMQYIGDLSGRVYDDSEQAFKDFQKDLGIYSSRKEEIRKNLGF